MADHGDMTLRRWGWWLGAAVGVVVLMAGVVMVRAGLERADQLASVIGSLVGVVGLGVAVFGVVVAIRADRRGVPPEKGAAAVTGPSNSVNKSTIKGSNVQIGRAEGDVWIEHER